MRVLILSQYYPPEIGAPQTRLAAFANALRRRNIPVEVVTAMPHYLIGRVHRDYRGLLFKRDSWENIPVVRTWVYAASGTGLRRLANYLSFTVSCFFGLLAARRPTHLFVESPPLFLILPALIFARLTGVALIFNVADLWPDAVRQLGLIKQGDLMLRFGEWLERFAYRSATYVTTVTRGMVDVLIAKKQVPASKVLFLPNGVDTELFCVQQPSAEIRDELGLAPADRLFIYAGSHGTAQGLETLVQAAALLREDNVVIAFIGDGHTKDAVQRSAQSLGLSNVRFVASQPLRRMPAFFSTATASIVPLIRTELAREARPSKMFPSLASGTPIIYSGEGEGANLVRSHAVGVVVPPESPPELAQAIRSLCDPSLREQLGSNARRLAEEQFDWNRIVGDWLGELERRTAEAASAGIKPVPSRV